MNLDWKNSLLIALVFVAGFAVGAAVDLPGVDTSKLGSSGGENAVSVMIDYGDGEVATYNAPLTAGENLFQVTEKLTKENNLAFESKEYEGLGTLITKIGKKENGVGDRYWQYWVNNQKPEVGASAYVPRPGDYVEWKFAPFKAE